MSFAAQLGKAVETPRDLLLGRYPDFVTGGPLPRGQVPVFVFHSLEPALFEAQLRHLKDNGYVTLGADEYFRVLVGAVTPPEKAVVLTFDDGRASLWSVGAPLLKYFGMRGIVFLVPGRTRSGDKGPTLQDVRDGRTTAAELLARERGPDGFLTWEEIDVLVRDGVYDFESHSMFHARVATAPEVVGFLAPHQQHGYAAMDVPWIAGPEGDRLAHEAALGTPILRSQPRLADARRFREEPGFGDACRELVAREGGASFFDRRGWLGRLRAVLGDGPVPGRLETDAERDAAIAHELADSRRTIEERTGRRVVHLCYPWHASSPAAIVAARSAGYRTAFCGKVAGVPITLPGGDPLSIARVGEDWLFCLPGKGRRAASAVLATKWKRALLGA